MKQFKNIKFVYNFEQLKTYIENLNINDNSLLLIDEYIEGIELEIDAISDGKNVYIPGIMQQIEKSGIHSGDSTTIFPAVSISDKVASIIYEYTEKICKAFKVLGFINIQFVLKDDIIYIIEINLRASRTVPFLSKITQIPMVDIATDTIIKNKLTKDIPAINKNFAVKMPIFSFKKFSKDMPYLGPEMKSTGEIVSIGKDLSKVIIDGFYNAGILKNNEVSFYIIVDEINFKETELLLNLLKKNKITYYLSDSKNQFRLEIDKVLSLIENHKISHIIDIYKFNSLTNIQTKAEIYNISLQYNIPYLTNLETIEILVNSLSKLNLKK